MAVRPILIAPDPMLRARCVPVTAFDADLAALVADMFDTLYDAPGRGLAAPQIGVGLRLFIMDETWREGAPTPRVFVNPQVRAASSEVSTRAEGCLSIPGEAYDVTRPATVDLIWQDCDGTDCAGRFAGFAAACVQHEIDHLDGVLITDRHVATA